ncbi:MAG TPA: alpha/beta hydrolase [Dehalococcoidia bacterium]|nr:alpha/beta hydrolase [Dehalococcoidia bacterium]
MNQPRTDYLKEMRAAAEAIDLNPREFVQPTDHWVDLNGIRFHYLDWGNPELPHLVLLHGGSLTAHTWDMSALLLRQHYHVVALNQRGHGDTGWTPEDQLGEDWGAFMHQDTEQFMDHLGFEKFVLCGMSMGGINSYHYAARHPGRLQALIIVDVAPVTMKEGIIEMAQFRQDTETLSKFEDFLERAIKFNPKRNPAHLHYSLLHSLKQVDDGWTWKQDHRRPQQDLSDEEAKKTREVRSEELWQDVKAITTPTLLMRGENSKILAAEAAEKTVASMHDAEFVVVPRATHNVHADNPKDFAAELISFVSRKLGN